MNQVRIIPPELLLEGYSRGLFPMSEERNDPGVEWFSARRRGVIPLDSFRVSRNVMRIIRQNRYHCKINTRFREVIERCAERDSTWISDLIIDSYEVLHLAGHAHSVELYNEQGLLSGGLYGVTLGAAFFGESMFRTEKEVDKVALWHCHQILSGNGFELWDTQFYNDHLAQFGCIEISAEAYEKQLRKALTKERGFRLL